MESLARHIRDRAVAQPPRPSRRWLRRRASSRGQTMVEVGLVLPIFILTLVSIIEFGYWAAVDSAVHTASREGARFGSTVDDAGGTPNYLDCDEIRDHVRELTAPLVTLTNAQIEIGYDDDDADAAPDVTCDSTPDEDDIDRWDRMVVEVNHTYVPITPILRGIIGDREMISIDRRSIVKCDPC